MPSEPFPRATAAMDCLRARVEDDTEALRRRIKAQVAEYKRGLENWSELNTHRGESCSVSLALLETAIERQIDAMGEADAREFIDTMFRRVVLQRAGGGHA